MRSDAAVPGDLPVGCGPPLAAATGPAAAATSIDAPRADGARAFTSPLNSSRRAADPLPGRRLGCVPLCTALRDMTLGGTHNPEVYHSASLYGVPYCDNYSRYMPPGYYITLAPSCWGGHYAPLWFFPNTKKTAARSAAKFSVPSRASI